MNMRTAPLYLAIGLSLASASACAQSNASNTVFGPQAPQLPQPNVGAVRDAQLAQVAAALNGLESGSLSAVPAELSHHALAGWMEYAALTRSWSAVTSAQATAFLQRYKGQPVADRFREGWLAETGKRADWAAFNAAWDERITTETLRCYRLTATLPGSGSVPAAWSQQALSSWLKGTTPPQVCTAPLQTLATTGVLTDSMRWERIRLAALEGNAGVIRDTARGLPAGDASLALQYADFLSAPAAAKTNGWPRTPLSATVASVGLARLAKNNPTVADSQLPAVASALGMDDLQRGRVLYQAALWAAAENQPDAARRFAAVPAQAYDERLHEARQREAMQRRDWRGVLHAIEQMGAAQRSDSRWTYFEGRMKELLGDSAGARAAYARAATKAEFHGYLAADKLNQPYNLCPTTTVADATARTRIGNLPGLQRAMMLYGIRRQSWAQVEWSDATRNLSDTDRIHAIEMAQTNGWFDRAVFDLNRTPKEQSQYWLRFPLHHEATIVNAARARNIDPEWVAAEIRAESVFNPQARSGANAIGLMQVIPATGATVARSIGEPWNGEATLLDPDANIRIGTAYLRQLKDRYGERPYYAIAGYNAGPGNLNRWKAQRPGWDPDLWIETISFKETREYVARILSFATLYDWRFNGTAIPVTARMNGDLNATRKAFTCPTPSIPAK